MNAREKELTLWLDGQLDPKAAKRLEADPEALAVRDEWLRLKDRLLAEDKSPSLPHPDFLNARVMEAIERDRPRREAGAGFSIPRLAWSGFWLLAAAAVVSAVLLPASFRRPDESEFISQVVSARAGNPRVSVSSFHAPGENGVVLWLEGTKFIPPEETVR